MTSLATHTPCVCVHSVCRKSVTTQATKPKSQEGGLCELAHTLTNYCCSSSSSSVASQSASSRWGESTPSTSTLLALCWVVDNA